jgi:hypothetical protein
LPAIKLLPVIQLLSTIYLLPAITVPGLLLLFPLDCACGGGACGGGRLVREGKLVVLVLFAIEADAVKAGASS